MSLDMSPAVAAIVAHADRVSKELEQAQLTDHEARRLLDYLVGYDPDAVAEGLRFIEFIRTPATPKGK